MDFEGHFIRTILGKEPKHKLGRILKLLVLVALGTLYCTSIRRVIFESHSRTSCFDACHFLIALPSRQFAFRPDLNPLVKAVSTVV
jgi:hypothetical protein